MSESAVHTRSSTDELLPHLDAAYNLARWLIGNPADAEDIVQEAYLSALRYFGRFEGGNSRAWLLTIVRNTTYSWYRKHQARKPDTAFDEGLHTPTGDDDPESLLLQRADTQMVERAISALPARFREVLILREMQGLSYKEIAGVAGLPIGTVMSSLSRARGRLRHLIAAELSRSPAGKTPAGVAPECGRPT
jgi:RNA polymerase sigma-70 factor (ECF subfamily)